MPAPAMPPCSQNPGRNMAATGSERSFVRPSSKTRERVRAPMTALSRMQQIAEDVSEVLRVG